MYEVGRGVKQDITLAIKKYEAAVDKKFIPSMIRLATFYNTKDKTIQNRPRAYELFSSIIRQSTKPEPNILYTLGMMSLQGVGTEKSVGTAQTWFHKAKEHKHGGSYIQLALINIRIIRKSRIP